MTTNGWPVPPACSSYSNHRFIHDTDAVQQSFTFLSKLPDSIPTRQQSDLNASHVNIVYDNSHNLVNMCCSDSGDIKIEEGLEIGRDIENIQSNEICSEKEELQESVLISEQSKSDTSYDNSGLHGNFHITDNQYCNVDIKLDKVFRSDNRNNENCPANQTCSNKQIFENGSVPSWDEMERRRKANSQGTKRVKQLEHECEVCGRIFSRKSFLKNHWVTHTLEKPFSCPQCDMKFTLAASMKRHLKTSHSAVKQYQCKDCGKSYAQAYSLACHVRTHLENHPYKCHLCGRMLTGPSHLKRHLELHNKPKEYKCGECNKAFHSTEDLKNHVSDEHSLTDKKYFCRECGRSFSKNSNLTYHMKIHNGERSHMCEICGQCFTLKSHMQRHIKKHHPEVYEDESAKLQHVDADEDMMLDPMGHFRSKPSAIGEEDDDHVMYTCSDCGRCFIKEEHLREHVRVQKHTGEMDHLDEDDEDEYV